MINWMQWLNSLSTGKDGNEIENPSIILTNSCIQNTHTHTEYTSSLCSEYKNKSV